MTVSRLILFLYLCGVLISGGLVYSLSSYGLLGNDEDVESSNKLMAKISVVLLSWVTVIIFICGIIKGIIIGLKREK